MSWLRTFELVLQIILLSKICLFTGAEVTLDASLKCQLWLMVAPQLEQQIGEFELIQQTKLKSPGASGIFRLVGLKCRSRSQPFQNAHLQLFKCPMYTRILNHRDFPMRESGQFGYVRPGPAMERSSPCVRRFFPYLHVSEIGREAGAVFVGHSLITLKIVIFSGTVLTIAGNILWSR